MGSFMEVLQAVTPESMSHDRVFTVAVVKLNDDNSARSAEIEPPGLGSKCGKGVQRLSDF